MLISHQQISTLGAPSKEGFVVKTIAFLRENTPNWAQSRDDAEIRIAIEEMIEVAAERRVTKEINIQKLLYHTIAYGLETFFSKALELQLAQAVFGEEYRVKCFIRQIQKYDVR